MKIRRAGPKALFLRVLSLILVLSLTLGNGISSFAVDEDPDEVFFEDTASEVPEAPAEEGIAPAEVITPVEEPAAEEPAAPVSDEEVPTEEPPAEEADIEEKGEEAPAEEAPADDVVPEEEPAPEEDTPAEEPTEESPAEEPVKEEDPAPAQEPAEDIPAEEAPAEEAPADEPAQEEEPEDEPPVVTYPAQTFTGRANAVTVNVIAPVGALPAGTVMKVTKVTDEDALQKIEDAVEGNVKSIKAVDISFWFNGQEIEPQKIIKVTLKSNVIEKAVSEVDIIHLDNEGETSLVKQTVNDNADEVSFQSKDFSVYAIVESDDIPQPPRVTYEFEDPNNADFYFIDKAGHQQTTQIIKDGEVLQDVGLPTIPSGEVFQGWYLYNGDNAIGKIAFESPIAVAYGTAGAGSTIDVSSITIDPSLLNADGTFHVKVKAYFGEVVYVTFYEDAAGTNILNRIQLPKGSQYNITTQEVNAPNSELAFVGWSETAGANDDDRTPITNTNITFNEDDAFYPVFKSGHWVTFYAGATGSGATYTAPAFVPAGETASAAGAQPTNPEWKGYTFRYWTTENIYTGENGAYVQPSSAPAQFNFNSTLNADTTLYAYWTPATTTYTVVWKQNISDDKNASDDQKTYSFAEQITENGTTGTTVNASNYSGRYTGFSLNTSKSDTSVVVKADGTSIINIYFDRKLITMNFDQDITTYTETTATTGTQYGYVDGQYVRITWNGTNWVYTTTEPVYTNYTGTRYNTTTSNNTTPQQYGVYNNQVITLYRHTNGGGHWSRKEAHTTFNDQQYNGTRYVVNTNGAYGFVNGAMVELNANGQYQSGTQNVEHVYTGTRYTQGTTRSFTGLYGQTLAQNGYSWPSQYIWTYGTNTIMTYLGQFVLPNNNDTSISFRSGGTAAKTVYFFLQNVDGSYPTTPSASGSATSTAGTFNVSNKYDGFEVKSYQLGNTGNGATGTWTNTAAGSSISLGNYTTLGVRFERKHFTLKYLDSVDNTELSGISNADVVYGASLTSYEPDEDFVPQSQYPGKVWDGKWYKDQACSEEFDWSVTMPNADMVVHAGWEDVYYKVDIDPNGGTLTASESTFTWLTYGQTIQRYDDVVRDYVEDASGTYKYESWLRKVYLDAGYDPWDYEGYLRSAGYVTNSTNTASEIHEYASGPEVGPLLDTVSYTYDSTRYKYEKGAYALIGWYEIHFEEGHYGDLAYKTGETLYTFGTGVTHDTYIQAKWRKVGEYHVEYKTDVYLMNEDGTIVASDSGIDTTNVPTDPNSYADNSQSAIMRAPDSPIQVGEGENASQYVFQGWYYDGQLYMPGDVFTILASLAEDKVIGQDGATGEDIIQKTVYIYPVYQITDNLPVDVTHIWWFGNFKDTDGVQISNLTPDSQPSNKTANNLQPNQAIDILTITELINGNTSYEGYTFKGWARVPVEGIGAVDPTASTFNASDYMYLYWSNGAFHVESETGTVVTQVAADENSPYHDMYAVWEKNTYTVTVKKVVVGTADDQKRGFVFDPDFTGYTGTGYNTNFILAGEETTFTPEGESTPITYYTTKEFLEVPYGATLTLTETPGNDFTVTVKTKQTTDAAGSAIANPEEVDSSNGATYTIAGDLEIVYTNTHKQVKVKIEKVDDDENPLEGVGFTLDGNTLTTGSDGLTAEVTLYSGDEYDLLETAPLAYFEGLAGKVVVKVDDTNGSAVPANTADAENVWIEKVDGVWVVTVLNPRKTFTVTVKKVIAGNMGDRNKTFSFTASYTLDGETVNLAGEGFTLGHNGTKEFEVPAGATLNVSETPEDYTPSNDKGNGASAGFEVTADGMTVTFTNTKEVVPDTGITLSSAPFIALFCLTVVGCVAVFTARKRRDEEES